MTQRMAKSTTAFTQMGARVRQIAALANEVAVIAGKPYVWRKDDRGRLYTVPYDVAYPPLNQV